MTKNKRYNWAVVNPETGRLMRESNDRRAIYPTRASARAAAYDLGGRVVHRATVEPQASYRSNLSFSLGT